MAVPSPSDTPNPQPDPADAPSKPQSASAPDPAELPSGDPPARSNRSPAEAARLDTIPPAAVARLSLYLRELRRLQQAGNAGISSQELGRRLGVSAAVVRRDLASLGNLGRRGIGYEVAGLIARIRAVLGADQVWNVALIGTGSLGTALLKYRGFAEQGFRLRAAFDIRLDRIGQQLGGVPVLPLDEMESTLARRQVTLAILAVPAEAAQDVADRLAAAGVTGILNFAPVTLRVRGETCVANVDLASELQQLSFAVVRQTRDTESS